MKIAWFELKTPISNFYPDRLLGYLLDELDELIEHVTNLNH